MCGLRHGGIQLCWYRAVSSYSGLGVGAPTDKTHLVRSVGIAATEHPNPYKAMPGAIKVNDTHQVGFKQYS